MKPTHCLLLPAYAFLIFLYLAPLPTLAQSKDESSAPSLRSVEEQVYQRYAIAQSMGSLAPLQTLVDWLDSLGRTEQNPRTDYWIAFTQKYIGFYHIARNDGRAALRAFDEGIKRLEGKSTRECDDYALMCSLAGWGMPYAGIRSPERARTLNAYGEKALMMDSLNVRVWVVLGENDLFSPGIFGGGSRAEEYFRRALTLPDQRIRDPFAPVWGREPAYAYLVEMLRKERRCAEADALLSEGLALYPNSQVLQEKSLR